MYGPSFTAGGAVHMFNLTFLATLKYFGFAVTAASTIWGLVKKTSFDDEDGNKRLTAAGQVSIALAIAGVLVGASAYGFEQSITASERAQQKVATDLKEARELDFRQRQDRAIIDTAAWNQRFEELQKASAAADRLADQLLVSGQTAARRDILFSRQLGEIRAAGLDRRIQAGTRSNLQRTEVALGHLERLVQPLNNLTVIVAWDIPARTGELARAIVPIEQLARTATSLEPETPLPQGCDFRSVRPIGRGLNYTGVTVTPACSIYPTAQTQPRLHEALPETTLIIFDLDHSSDEAIRSELGFLYGYVIAVASLANTVGDAILSARSKGSLAYDIASRTIRMTAESEPITGDRGLLRLTSIPDLEHSQLIIVPKLNNEVNRGNADLHRGLQLRGVIIVAERRVYRISGASFRRVGNAFVSDSIGRPVPHGLASLEEE